MQKDMIMDAISAYGVLARAIEADALLECELTAGAFVAAALATSVARGSGLRPWSVR
jgi:hypothetical protein